MGLEDNKVANLPISCVITGQGMNSINKAERTAEEILKYPVRFGNLKTANLIKPDVAGAYGIVKYISNIKHSKNIGSKIQVIEEQTFFDNVVQSVKSIFGSKSKKNTTSIFLKESYISKPSIDFPHTTISLLIFFSFITSSINIFTSYTSSGISLIISLNGIHISSHSFAL